MCIDLIGERDPTRGNRPQRVFGRGYLCPRPRLILVDDNGQ